MPRFLGGSIVLVALWAAVAVSAAVEPVDVASDDCSGDTSPRWQNQRELGDDDNQSNGVPGDFTRLSSALAADNAVAFEDDDEDDEHKASRSMHLWSSNNATAVATYGDINTWNSAINVWAGAWS